MHVFELLLGILRFDVNITKKLTDVPKKEEFWSKVRAAFESGWGFSSKHFHDRNIYYNTKGKINFLSKFTSQKLYSCTTFIF